MAAVCTPHDKGAAYAQLAAPGARILRLRRIAAAPNGLKRHRLIGGEAGMFWRLDVWRAVMVVWLLLACFVCGCERSVSDGPPPLRPLVYTELPPAAEVEVEAAVEKMINIAPEDLGYALFHALVDHDRAGYESMFISGEGLSLLIRMNREAAQRESGRILGESEILWTLFAPALKAEEPIGGLSARLRLLEFRVGKGRNLAGKIAIPGQDDVVQHWGNELRIELIGTDKIFVIRVPKIVKTGGGWRIAEVVSLDNTLRMYLEAGMHLKTDLLTSEHYPFPLEVGNYWKYRIEDGSLEEPEPLPHSESTVTHMISEIIHREGYWIVTFERTYVDGTKSLTEGAEVRRYSLLVTPRMVYPCARDCRNQVDSIGYLLGYISRQTPVFVFPLEVGRKWNEAGRKANYNRYEVRARHEERIVVPSGAFGGAYEIFGSIEEGRESRYFVPGTGTIMRVVRSGVGQKREVLIRYRLIL